LQSAWKTSPRHMVNKIFSSCFQYQECLRNLVTLEPLILVKRLWLCNGTSHLIVVKTLFITNFIGTIRTQTSNTTSKFIKFPLFMLSVFPKNIYVASNSIAKLETSANICKVTNLSKLSDVLVIREALKIHSECKNIG